MIITQLTNLQATPVKGDYTDAGGVRQTINHSPAHGIIRQISIGPSGILIRRGKVVVALPMDELLKAAEAAEPALAAPVGKPATPNA